MELKQKGSETNLGRFKQLMVSMKWTTDADFDLAAAYEYKDGKLGLVCFGDIGDPNCPPYIQPSEAVRIDDIGADNEEIMRITKLDDKNYIWILCWDFEKVQDGAPARFKESNVSLTIMDDRGTTHDVALDTKDMGNVALIATIDNTSPVGAKLVNSSKAATLKGLKNFQQLMDIIKG